MSGLEEGQPAGGAPVAVRVFVLIALYLLLAHARSVQPHPIIPDAVMAIQLIVPVIAGLIGGPRIGALVGGVGTLLAILVYALRELVGPSGAIAASSIEFEALSLIPNVFAGVAAGILARHLPSPLPACALVISNVLSVGLFVLVRVLPPSSLAEPRLWLGVAWESFIGVALVTISVGIYRLAFERGRR